MFFFQKLPFLPYNSEHWMEVRDASIKSSCPALGAGRRSAFHWAQRVCGAVGTKRPSYEQGCVGPETTDWAQIAHLSFLPFYFCEFSF